MNSVDDQPGIAPAPPEEKTRETLPESIASIATVLAVGLFIMTFVFQNFEIPSGSMEKTLLIGDHVLVDRLAFAGQSHWAPFIYHRPAQRGDMIVFFKPHPEHPELYLVKRLIGMPGDRIHLRDGVVYRNGVALVEPYAAMPSDDGNPIHALVPYRDDYPSDPEGAEQLASNNHAALWAEELPSHIQNGDIVVPPGMIFAMGDNRLESLDSRFFGFVPIGNIVGRPILVYWSFKTPTDQVHKESLGERAAFFVHVILHFFTETRWSRTMHLLR